MIRARVRGDSREGIGVEALEELRPRAMKAVKRGLLILEGKAKEVLTGTRSGRKYRRSKTGPPHVASAPGEAPAVDTGRLRASLTHDGPVEKGDTIRGDWGTNVEYAEALEHGTSQMAARPWARPAEEQARSAVDRVLEGL